MQHLQPRLQRYNECQAASTQPFFPYLSKLLLALFADHRDAELDGHDLVIPNCVGAVGRSHGEHERGLKFVPVPDVIRFLVLLD